jgi:hypothetical protein
MGEAASGEYCGGGDGCWTLMVVFGNGVRVGDSSCSTMSGKSTVRSVAGEAMTVESAAVVTVSPLETLGRTTGGCTFEGDRTSEPFGLMTLTLPMDSDPGRNGAPLGDRVGDLCSGEYAIGSCSRGDIAPVPILCALAWPSACMEFNFSAAHRI